MLIHNIGPRSKAVSPVTGVSIKEISCGSNHTIAIDEKFRVSSMSLFSSTILFFRQIRSQSYDRELQRQRCKNFQRC
jgi:alpha-tubulin suppressor-like RCC1 family protein